MAIETKTHTHVEGQTGVQRGCVAPDFALMDTDMNTWRLSDHRGRVVTLLFYPRDDTPVCTRQMCSVRHAWNQYQATGSEVAAISVDSVASHKKFAERHHLPQRLLADEHRDVTNLYQLRSWLGHSQRAVIIIDPQGVIRYCKTWLPIFRPREQDILNAIDTVAQSCHT